jgi:hypothetical protein
MAGATVMLLRALGAAAFHAMVTDTESLTPARIEAVGHFKFPPGAANIRSRFVSWMDYSLNVSFTLPPAEVDALLATTLIQRPLSTTAIPHSHSLSDGWWNPGTPAAFEAGVSGPDIHFVALTTMSVDDSESGAPATRPAYQQFILIDKTNPQLYRVWLLITG